MLEDALAEEKRRLQRPNQSHQGDYNKELFAEDHDEYLLRSKNLKKTEVISEVKTELNTPKTPE